MTYSQLQSHDWERNRLRLAIKNNLSICLNGFPSVGKTTLVNMTLEDDPECLSAYINCRFFATASELYLRIIKSLADSLGDRKLKHKLADQGVIAFHSFHNNFAECLKSARAKNFKRVYVVLDEFDVLWKTSSLEAVGNLAILDDLKLIFISSASAPDVISYFKVAAVRARIEDQLVAIDLPPWTKEDTIKIILQEVPEKCQDLYEKFVHNVVIIVYSNNTKDFIEIRAFCQEHFGKFLEFYKKKVVEKFKKYNADDADMSDYEIDEFKLPQAHVTQIIASYLQSFKEIARKNAMGDWERADIDNRVVSSTSILIIAAYVAANTRPPHDKQNWVNFQKRGRISRKIYNDEEASISSSFTLERLIQIYQSMFIRSRGISSSEKQSPIDYPDSILGDITTLEKHNIVKVVSGDGFDALTRYKINNSVPRAYIQRLAGQNNISLEISGLQVYDK